MTPEQWKEEEVLSGMGLDDKKNCVEIDLFVNDQEKADQIASLFGVRSDNRVYFLCSLHGFSLLSFPVRRLCSCICWNQRISIRL